jgi:putative nucleotidyltransferase with HDIG domain
MSPDQQTSVASVLDHAQKLPSLPSVVLEILESFDNERMDVSTLAGKIANDQALVARVMRVANSAFFGLSGQVGTIFEAISVLGFNNLRGLVTAAAIINASPKNLGEFDLVVFWRHGICTAACAKVLAKRLGLNPEIAFTAGVLHDIGKLIIVMGYPAAAKVVAVDEASDESFLEAERNLIGYDHAALGGELAQRWKFPQAIRDAIRLHHSPPDASGRSNLSDVVYIANLFAHALDQGKIREQKFAMLAAEAYDRLTLDQSEWPALAQAAQQLYMGSIQLVGE